MNVKKCEENLKFILEMAVNAISNEMLAHLYLADGYNHNGNDDY